jgi:hypothetical protein
MEGKIKEGADGQEEGDGAVVLKRRQHVTMGMEVLDCPVCYNPLSPPIFQVTSTGARTIRGQLDYVPFSASLLFELFFEIQIFATSSHDFSASLTRI